MEAEQRKDNDGLSRAVLLMMSLEKPVLARLLRHLSTKELTRLVQAQDIIAKSSAPSDLQLMEVGKAFLSSNSNGSPNKFKDALAMAFGEDGADQIMRQDQWRTMAERVKPEKFAAVLRGERAEAVAITLSQLPPRFAADVLAQLPEEQRIAAVENLSRTETTPRAGLDAVLRAVEQSVNASSLTDDLDRKAAAKRAAAVLNQLDAENASAIIEHLRAGDPEGAALIEGEMFQFRDLLKLDNRALQAVLAEVRPDQLARALKGTTDQERNIIFAALTEQVRSMVEAEFSESGPVPAREVKAARRELTDLALQMDRQGRIRIRPEQDLMA